MHKEVNSGRILNKASIAIQIRGDLRRVLEINKTYLIELLFKRVKEILNSEKTTVGDETLIGIE